MTIAKRPLGIETEGSLTMVGFRGTARMSAAALILMLAVWQGGACAEDAKGPGAGGARLERDLTAEQRPMFALDELHRHGRIDVDAWVDRPDLTYAVGDALRISVRPHQPCYITMVDVGSSGRVAVLFPNHFQRARRVRAGSTLTIPASGVDWNIKVGGPAGVDLIQVIASRAPLALPELAELVRATAASPTVTLGRSAGDVARDLTVQLAARPGSAGRRSRPAFGMRNVLIRITPAPT